MSIVQQNPVQLCGSAEWYAKVEAWSYDMQGRAKKCVNRYCELAIKNIEQLEKVSKPFIDDHQFRKEELETVVDVSNVCPRIVLECL